MHNGNTLRIIMVGTIAAFAVSAPAAMAKPASASSTGVAVCNQATANNASGEGNLDSSSFGDTGPAARYQENLKAHRGRGAGLINAAANSPALSQCIVPGDGGSSVVSPGGDGMAT